jgi:hypothetical protein
MVSVSVGGGRREEREEDERQESEVEEREGAEGLRGKGAEGGEALTRSGSVARGEPAVRRGARCAAVSKSEADFDGTG